MGQTKRQSLAETVSNTFVGMVGSFLITYLNMAHSTLSTETTATLIVVQCTVWSLIRGYYVRRAFNSLSTRTNHDLEQG